MSKLRYNSTGDMLEVAMAEDIKKELVEKAKELLENFDNEKEIYSKLSSLKKGFRVSYDEMSFYEQELQDQFDSYIKKIEEKLNIGKENAESIKNSIIAKAEELKKFMVEEKNFNETRIDNLLKRIENAKFS